MLKKTTLIIFALLFVVSIASDGSSQARGTTGRPAPGNMPGKWWFIPKADFEAIMGPTRGDRSARMVPVGGDAQLGAYILHYPVQKSEMPNSFYHPEISEIYYVIRGEGTALLGGELEDAKLAAPGTKNYREITGTNVTGKMKNYQTVKWGPGDVIIVPAGVPHMIGWEVTVPNDILRVVLDPKKRMDPVLTTEASRARLKTEGEPQPPAPAGSPTTPNIPGQTFTIIPKKDTEALMKGEIGDTPARVVKIPGGSNVGVFVLHMQPRKPPAGLVSSFYHSEVSELYYIVRGSGAAMMGGELENATWDDSNSASIRNVRGPSVNGNMKNAVPQKFTPGDAIMVAAGVPHAFTYEVVEPTDIIRVVIDHKGLLTLK